MHIRNVGIVGFGDIAKTYLQALDHCPMLRLVAITDIRPVSATDIPPGVQFFNRAKDMYQKSSIDAVIIATPYDTHAEMAIEAVFSGVDVLVEKPIAVRRNEFSFVASTALEQDRLVVGALHARYGREVEWFLKNHEDLLKKVPPLTSFLVRLNDPYMKNGMVTTNKELSLGTPWLDSGINALSILNSILAPLDVSELTLESVGNVGDVFEFHTLGTYSFTTPWNKKGKGIIECSWGEKSATKSTRLGFADASSIVLDHGKETVQLIDSGENVVFYQDCRNDRPRLVNHYVRVLGDFATALQTRISNLDTMREINTHFFAVLDEIENLKKVTA